MSSRSQDDEVNSWTGPGKREGAFPEETAEKMKLPLRRSGNAEISKEPISLETPVGEEMTVISATLLRIRRLCHLLISPYRKTWRKILTRCLHHWPRRSRASYEKGSASEMSCPIPLKMSGLNSMLPRENKTDRGKGDKKIKASFTKQVVTRFYEKPWLRNSNKFMIISCWFHVPYRTS